MANSGGLIGSFLETFSGLQDMERQRRRDQEQIAQQAVDNELRRSELALRNKQFTELDKDRDERLGLSKDVEARRAGDAQERQRIQRERNSQAQQRIDQFMPRLNAEQYRTAVTEGQKKERELIAGGVPEEDARVMGQEKIAEIAQQFGLSMPGGNPQATPVAPGAAPVTGVLGNNAPLTLSGQAAAQAPAAPPVDPMQQRVPIGVLPKIAEAIKLSQTRDKLLGDRDKLVNLQTEKAQNELADMATMHALRKQYEENRIRSQNQRFELGLIDKTAKRLGIDIAKLTIQEKQGHLAMQPIDMAIKQLEYNKKLANPGWTEDQKNLRDWLIKKNSMAESEVKNAEQHFSRLQEAQRITKGEIESATRQLSDKSKLTAAEVIQLTGSLAGRQQIYNERQAEINKYANELQSSRRDRDTFTGAIDKMTASGLGAQNLTKWGTPQKGLPPLPGLDQSKAILGGSSKDAHPGYILRDGPKGYGYYKK